MILSEKNGDRSLCLLCPHRCSLAEGSTGICGARINRNGVIIPVKYGILSAYSSDPVEKKPFYHWFPGYNILSAGSYGCNLSCDFCQNHEISQYEIRGDERVITPEKIISDALNTERNVGIAFTYNEPVISFEFIRDTFIAAKEKGLSTALVSNGYVNAAPLEEIISFTDAFNIDLKAFHKEFYRMITGATLAPVLNTLRKIAASGKHLEITTLIIPGLNDSLSEMEEETEWISSELGKNIPLHLSRYFPMFKRKTHATSASTLAELRKAAAEKLEYVYVGNINTENGHDTSCPSCGSIVTVRRGYTTIIRNMTNDGCCSRCGQLIYRSFTPSELK